MGVHDVGVGDLFESGAQTLVNTVNCVGVMGKGIALAFRKRFPEMYEDYVARCERKQVQLGRPYLWTGGDQWVLNFPTKDHWRSVSRLADIERGLDHLVEHQAGWGIQSLAVPPLGCGHGGLDWSVVGPTLHRALDRLSIPVILYAPHGTPPQQLELGFLVTARHASSKGEATAQIPAAWLALVEILRRVTSKQIHPPVGRTKFQKIAYFATVAGIPTNLTFQRRSYGPFADGLKPQITKLVNNGLLAEERRGRMILNKPGRTFEDARRNRADQIASWESALDRVTDLLMRMDTSDAELAATVHFAYAELAEASGEAPSEDEVLAEVLAWKRRRDPPIEASTAASAVRSLNWLGWIDAKPSDLPLAEESFLTA